MLIYKAFRYRLYPTATQQQALAIEFGHARFVWNWALELRKSTYQKTGKGIGFYELKRRLTELKHQPETKWLCEAGSQALQAKLEDLERAYQEFYSKRARYPRFKTKKSNQSVRYPQRFNFSDHAIRLPKIGWVKAILHRPLEGKAKNITVSKTKAGKYFASVLCEVEISPLPIKDGEIGIDLGIKSFLVDSLGNKVAHPKHLQQAEKRLRRSQRCLSHRKKGSKGWEKARLIVARLHEKVANQRADFLHKLSRNLANQYGLIGIENLNVLGMVKNRRLAKAISSTGWGAFRVMLEYKAVWYRSKIEKVGQFYPSSKTCSRCGYILPELPLVTREWDCPVCATHHDRDRNAAINILKQARVGATQSYAVRECISPDNQAVLVEARNLSV